MSLMHMPRVARLRLEQIQRNFLWDGEALEKKLHLVKALLFKWSWRFAVERESLWRLVISRKFGVQEGGWCTREVREGYESCFRETSFEALVFPLWWVSLLGKHRGGRF
ncbi:hypothetical protein CK203_021450 [Vitis vinifera]|uniref:Uncharacterized protein n=1 Tax=Vitis vinifera TaxID=29760 RepID=A0A438ISD8_VITVI|nr:hypothetical protein CK203_021450 [Vitis vinifera]